jgi:predicted RNase H-related nuclease YkuK (DUF458 family)
MRDKWFDSDGNEYTICEIVDSIKDYVHLGGKIFVGTDSMLFTSSCVYATAICLHNADMKVAKYFYSKARDRTGLSKNLKHKITKEVNYSIDVSLFLLEQFPDADIEIHADVGTSKKSATSKFVEFIRGWIIGSGFEYKIKPNSWASSSVADWHTKRS